MVAGAAFVQAFTRKRVKIAIPSLVTTRERIISTLANQEQKIIIVIDDIDRLTGDEVRQVFRLVKAVADFPNTVYILSMEREVVVDALNQFHPGRGSQYLEKIVQVGIRVPAPSSVELESLVLDRLEKIQNDFSMPDLAGGYFKDVLDLGLMPYIASLRDIKRYCNSLMLGLALVHEEVNFPDFVAITVMQVFEEELYSIIKSHRQYFAGTPNVPIIDPESQEIKDFITRSLERVSEERRLGTLKLLQRLFPKVSSSFNAGWNEYEGERSWQRDMRVCSEKHFATYFQLSLDRGQVSRHALMRFVAALPNLDQARTVFARHQAEGQELDLLDSVPALSGQLAAESIPLAVQNLTGFADSFPPEGLDGFGRGAMSFIIRAVIPLLDRYQSPNELWSVLHSLIGRSDLSLFGRIDILAAVRSEANRLGNGRSLDEAERATLTVDGLADLTRLACNEILQWSVTPDALSYPYAFWVMKFWADWAGRESVCAFANRVIEKDAGLAAFIAVFLRYQDKSRKLDTSLLMDFINLQALRPRLEDIAVGRSSEVIPAAAVEAVAMLLLRTERTQSTPAAG